MPTVPDPSSPSTHQDARTVCRRSPAPSRVAYTDPVAMQADRLNQVGDEHVGGRPV